MEDKRRAIAGYFDHTLLKAFATEEDIENLCREAKEVHTYSVCVNPSYVAVCHRLLADSDVKVCSVIDFPLGCSDLDSKQYECEQAIAHGADEIDYVLHIGRAKMHDWDYIRLEMERLTDLCHSKGAGIKVIFETCYLNTDEITQLTKIAKEVKPDFIKTSTGFGTEGATVENVKRMVEEADGQVKVKASGGIRDWATCKAMLDAGASRIGVSASLAILDEINTKLV